MDQAKHSPRIWISQRDITQTLSLIQKITHICSHSNAKLHEHGSVHLISESKHRHYSVLKKDRMHIYTTLGSWVQHNYYMYKVV